MDNKLMIEIVELVGQSRHIDNLILAKLTDALPDDSPRCDPSQSGCGSKMMEYGACYKCLMCGMIIGKS